MQGTITFHPVDLAFFDEVVQPLVEGKKVNPESWLEAALRMRVNDWYSARCIQVLEDLLDQLEPPPPPEHATLWEKVRTRLERFDFRPPRLSVLAAQTLKKDLHLNGRPFFIAEGSADRVAQIVDEYRGATSESEVQSLVLEQIVCLHPELAALDLEEEGGHAEDRTYRAELLKSLKKIFDLANAARTGDTWGRFGTSQRMASDALADELPWRALVLHSRAVPYWIAEDVDGLESICQAAGLEAPPVMTPAWRLFGSTCEEYPAMMEKLGVELNHARSLGAFVAPQDVAELLAFLNVEGSKIIRAAAEHDQGQMCATLLKKIRECLHYAESRGMGYLEAAGLPTLGES